MSEKKKNDKVVGVGVCLFVMIVVALGLIVWLLTAKNETYISTEIDSGTYESLECTASHPDDPFFVSALAQRFAHNVKMMFMDDKLMEISYRFDGTYSNDDQARKDESLQHADYNEYMVANELSIEILNPVFSTLKNKLMISLYAESNKINSAVAHLFFVNREDFEAIGDYKSEDYRKMYESKGFTCKIGK